MVGVEQAGDVRDEGAVGGQAGAPRVEKPVPRCPRRQLRLTGVDPAPGDPVPGVVGSWPGPQQYLGERVPAEPVVRRAAAFADLRDGDPADPPVSERDAGA